MRKASTNSNTSGQVAPPDRLLSGLVIAAMLNTLVLGWGALSGKVPFNYVFLLMLPVCLAPIAWYGYGFLKISETEQDFGLLFSALGWGFIAVSLLVRHAALNADWSKVQASVPGADANTLGQSAAANICTGLGILCIMVGAAFALHAYQRNPHAD